MDQALRVDLSRSAMSRIAAGPFERVRPAPLAQFIAALDNAAAGDEDGIDHRVAEIVRAQVEEPELLAGIACTALSQRYARHILHAALGYSLLALVWRPGQMSSVHGHKTWCVLGLHRGSLTESLFEIGGTGLRLVGARQHHPGSVSHAPAVSDQIHRIANLGVETAVSIHVYGVPFERLNEHVNRVWAE
jgi:3-mercaptopropionate dioxygenase